MRSLTTVLALVVLAIPTYATQIVNYGWEDGGTLVGMYPLSPTPGVVAANVMAPDPVYGGTHSLKLARNVTTTTPQAYVAWVKGLQAGDSVTASFWVYDTGNPSGRIWAHWNDTPYSNGYSGSASGPSAYSVNGGWSQLTYTWTVPSPHTGIVIEARTYGALGDIIWVDDMQISVPDAATVVTPEPATMALCGLAGLALIRRRK